MTQLQKIIKYSAMAFAIFLTVSIVGSIVSGIALFTGIQSAKNKTDGDMPGTTYENTIEKLDIDVAGVDLTIKVGESLSVETNNDNITQKEKNGKLTITEKKHNWLGTEVEGTLIIIIPKDTILKDVEIDAGAGKVEIRDLTTQNLDLTLGAGKVEIRNLTVTQATEIDGGAGNLAIMDSTMHNLDLDMGIGELEFVSKVTGNSDIDFGIGKANITLIGSLADYRLRMSAGIGKTTIDGESMTNGTYYGEGSSLINMEGGIGAVEIVFQAENQKI